MNLIVTAKKLNLRKFVPAKFPERESIIGQVPEGFRFIAEEVDQSLIPNPSLGKWYRDRDEHFYWGGGVEEEIVNRVISLAQTNYNLQIQNIPEIWRVTQGNNIQIAILDSGFIPHIDLKSNIIDTFNAVDNTTNVLPIGHDNVDHGNNVAGLIAASSSLTDGITGIAPRSKLILVKISNNEFIDPEVVLNGLEYVLTKTNARIINLSFSIDESEYNQFENQFLTLFEKAKSKGVVIIASAGENSDLINSNTKLLLPANEDYCLSIGTVNSIFLQNHPNPTFHSSLNLIIPNQRLRSCAGKSNSFSEISNSSMAAAITSGTAALLCSHLNGSIDTESFIKKLCDPLKEFNTNIMTDLSIYKL